MSQSPSKAEFLTRSIHTDTAMGHVIQTRYAGYKFRSRLEAKWAVLFQNLNLQWEYEPEGYIVNGRPYLPDFRVHSWDAWVECKPITERDNDFEHWRLIAMLAYQTSVPNGFVLFGAPDLMAGNFIAEYHDNRASYAGYGYVGTNGLSELWPDEFVTLAYRKAMEERFDARL